MERVHLLMLLGFSKSGPFTDQTMRQRAVSGEGVCELCMTGMHTSSLKVKLKNTQKCHFGQTLAHGTALYRRAYQLI